MYLRLIPRSTTYIQASNGETCDFYAVLENNPHGPATLQGFALAGNEWNTSGCENYSHVLAKDLDTTLALMRAVFDAGQASVCWFRDPTEDVTGAGGLDGF